MSKLLKISISLITIVIIGTLGIALFQFLISPITDDIHMEMVNTQIVEAIKTEKKYSFVDNTPKPTFSDIIETIVPKSIPTPEITPKPTTTHKSTVPTPYLAPRPPDNKIAMGEHIIDISNNHLGFFIAGYNNESKSKIGISTNDYTIYRNLPNDNSIGLYSLTRDSSDYSATIYKNIGTNIYRIVDTYNFTADIQYPTIVFLIENDDVKFDEGDIYVQKANELVKDIKTQPERVRAIYDYIVHNYSYDFIKLNSLDKDYISDPTTTFESQKGICIDFAVLTAAMYRSQGIPCKLVTGYADKVSGYHAWNEVYIDGEFKIIDISSDSQRVVKPFLHDSGYYPTKYN